MENYHAAIYQNLRLLLKIYPSADLESKLEKNMFKKPNTKGLQSVFYYFISILNPVYASQRIPWPVSFTSDSHKFKTSVVNFIMNECEEFQPPKLLPSLLSKAHGEKCVLLVFDFTNYVTRKLLHLKYKVRTMNKLKVFSDSMGVQIDLMNAVMADISREYSEVDLTHQKVMKNTLKLRELSEKELTNLLTELGSKRNELHKEVKDDFPDSNLQNTDLIKVVIADREEEIQELKVELNTIRSDLNELLLKLEKLVQLIRIQRASQHDVIDSNYFSSLLTEELASILEIPLQKIKSLLYRNSDCDSKICFVTFLKLGLLTVKLKINKFRNFQAREDQPTNLAESSDEIYHNAVKRLQELTSIESNLDSLITDCLRDSHPPAICSCSDINNGYLELMNVMQSLGNFRFPADHNSEEKQTKNNPVLLNISLDQNHRIDPIARWKEIELKRANSKGKI